MSSEEESFDSLNRRKRKRITESVIDTDNEDGGECSQTKDEDGDINDDDIFVKRKRVSKSRLISSDEEEDAKACSEVSLESDEYSEGESGSSEADSSDASDDEDYVDEECDDETVIEDVDEAVDSDVSDGQSDKCPICLNKFRGQDTGTPESCDHVFCLDCIQVWARNVNTCPVDRQIFNLILVKDLGDKIIRRIPVAGKADDAEELAENDPTFCEVCGRGDREDRLLLCDACDLGYHCECLEPPIFDIPIEEWFCPDCAPNHDPNNVEVMDEVRNLVHNGFRPAPFNAPRRAIARTRASENVRSRIERLRMLALDGLTVGVDVPARPTATPARRNVTTRRRYKRTRRRRTTRRKKKTTTTTSKTKLSSTGKTKTVRRRRRKTKGRRKGKRTVRSRRAARPLLTTDSVKKRIANKLGLRRPPPGRTIPLVKSKSSGDRSIFGGRSEHGPALSIFGNREELIEFEDSYMSDDNQAGYGGGGSGDVLATVRLTSSHRASVNLKKAATILNQAKSNKRVPLVIPTPSTSSASFDILGSILQNQSILHSSSQKVKISKDGNLVQSGNTTSPVPLAQKMAVKKRPMNPTTPSASPSRNERNSQQPSSQSSSSSSRSTNNQRSLLSQDDNRVGWESGANNNDGDNNNENSGGESPCAFDTRRKPIKNKDSKPSQSDDDIDIYSDIETISNEEVEVFPQANTDENVKCNSASSVQSEIATSNIGHINVSDSSDDELVIDEEAAQEHELTQKMTCSLDLESISGPDSPDPEGELYSPPRSKMESVCSINSSQGDYPGSIDVESVDAENDALPISRAPKAYNPESPTTDDTPVIGDDSQEEKAYPKSDSQNEDYDPELSIADNGSEVDENAETGENNIAEPSALYDPEASVTGDDASQENMYNPEEPGSSDEQESNPQEDLSRHNDEDDVISAKVGSPISESEDITDVLSLKKKPHNANKEIVPQTTRHDSEDNDKDVEGVIEPSKEIKNDQEGDDENYNEYNEDYEENYDGDYEAYKDADHEETNQENDPEGDQHTEQEEGDADQEFNQETGLNMDVDQDNDQVADRDIDQEADNGEEDQEADNGEEDQEADHGEEDQEADHGEEDQEGDHELEEDQEGDHEGEEDQEGDHERDEDQEQEIDEENEMVTLEPKPNSDASVIDGELANKLSNIEACSVVDDKKLNDTELSQEFSSKENSSVEENQDPTFGGQSHAENNQAKLISDGVEDISDVGSDDNQLDYGEDDNTNNESANQSDLKPQSNVDENDDDDDEDGGDKLMDEDDDDVLPAEIEEIADDIKLEKSDVEDFEEEKVSESKTEEKSFGKKDLPFVPVVVQKHIHKETCSKSRNSRSSSKAGNPSKSSDKVKGDKSDSEINWKKPSKSTKERSYRDGKFRDEKVIFGERELKDKEGDKKRERRKDDNYKGSDRKTDKYEDSDRRRDESDRRGKDGHERLKDSHHEKKKDDRRGSSRSEKHRSTDRRDHARVDKEHHYSDKDHENPSDRRHRDKNKPKEHHEKSRSRHDKDKSQNFNNSGKRSDKDKNRDSSKHGGKLKRKDLKSPDQLYKYNDPTTPDKYFAYDEEYGYMYDDQNLEPFEKRKDRDVRKVDDKIIVEKHEKPSKKDKGDRKLREEIYNSLPTAVDSKSKVLSDSPSPDISDIESKEIFSKEDGRIIINVNYNRNKETPAKEKPQQAITANEADMAEFDGAKSSNREPESKKMRTAPQISWNNSNDGTPNTKEWAERGDHPVIKPRSPLSPPPEEDSNGSENKSLGYAIIEEKIKDKPKQMKSSRKKQGSSKARSKDHLLSKPRQKGRHHPEVITISESDEEMAGARREGGSPLNDRGNSSASHSGESPKEHKRASKKPSSDGNSNQDQDGRNKDSLNFSGMFKRQPRSPSPPSPMDNESYDPCEPTRSPSFKGSDGNNSSNHSESLSRDPKPPPEPELPPLPPEPEPQQNPAQPPTISNNTIQPAHSSPSVMVSQSIAMQTMITAPMTFTQASQFQNTVQGGTITSLPNIHIPPPNFMTQTLSRNMAGGPVPLVTAGIQGLQGLRWSLGGGPPTMLFPAGTSQLNQMQHVMHGNFISHQLPHQRLSHPGAQISGMMQPPNGSSLATAMLHPMRQQLPGPPLLPTPTMGPHGNPGSMNSLPLTHRQINLPDMTQPPPNILSSHHQHNRLGHDVVNRIHGSMQQGPSSPLIKTYTTLPMIVSSMPLVTTVPVTVISQSRMPSGMNLGPMLHGPGNKSSEAMGVVDMEVDSPYSPADSPGADQMDENVSPDNYKNGSVKASSSVAAKVFHSNPPKDAFDALLAAVPKLLEDKATRDLLVAGAAKVSKLSAANASKNKGVADKASKGSRKHVSGQSGSSGAKQKGDPSERTNKHKKKHHVGKKGVAVKRNETQLKIIDDVPSSAVEMQVKEKYMKKLNRQERVVEEVKLSLKPFYNKKDISKEDYKAILRKCVPKVCHNKTGEINPVKIKAMVDTYVKKYRHMRKKGLKNTFES